MIHGRRGGLPIATIVRPETTTATGPASAFTSDSGVVSPTTTTFLVAPTLTKYLPRTAETVPNLTVAPSSSLSFLTSNARTTGRFFAVTIGPPKGHSEKTHCLFL